MPAYLVFREPSGLNPFERFGELIHKPKLKDLVESARKGVEHGLKEAIEKTKLKSLYNKDHWVVRKLDLKDNDWKHSNIVFILPPLDNKAIHLKAFKIMEYAKKVRKECLVTVGATAPFEQLIQAALSPEVLNKLIEKGFTTVNYQYGDSFQLFHEVTANHNSAIKVYGFGFKREGLGADIKKCKKEEGKSEEGLVITHAGKFPLQI